MSAEPARSRTLDADRRVELLALAPGWELTELAERCVERQRPHVLTGPDVGMVMLPVREPVEATRFYLGEVLATRAEVELAGSRGWSMRLGDDRVATMAAAILDAEAAGQGPLAAAVDALCWRTAAAVDAAEAEEWAALAPTEVRFEGLD